jgi:molybdopterin/thiamine biosynthesis adenylyltransferase
MYPAAAGVGTLSIVDPDQVDLTNLQRQIIHTTAQVGQTKVASAHAMLAQLNPHVQVNALAVRADALWLDSWVPRATVVLDCSDNFATRHAVNRACVHHRVPLVSGAALRFDGQITSFDARSTASPCYACLFPPDQPFEEVACASMGVFAPLVGIIGAMQAAEALRLIAGVGTPLVGRLVLHDALRGEWNTIRYARQADCMVCGTAHA